MNAVQTQTKPRRGPVRGENVGARERVFRAGQHCRDDVDGYRLLLAAVIGQAFLDLRDQSARPAALSFLESQAAAELAVALGVLLPDPRQFAPNTTQETTPCAN